MIKFTILLRRNPKLTQDEFVALHRTHATLFTSLPDDIKQHIRGYVLSHPTEDRLPGIPEATFDGIVDFWFDDLNGLGTVLGSKEYMATIRPDEERLLDVPRCEFFLSTETTIIE